MKVLSTVALTALSIVLFSGCGGGGDSTTPPAAATLTGTFVDAPVQGLSYKTATQSGFTDANGQFIYVAGEEVELKLGNLSLGKGTAGALITPYTICDNNDTATNVALLLQNFDVNRSNTGVLDLSKLKDYDFSDVNLSIAPSVMETEIARLSTAIQAHASFGPSFLDANTTLIDAATVKTTMDTYIAENSTAYDMQFTQAYLNNTVFYKSSVEYPQYMNKYVNGDIFFAGDTGTLGWDSTFDTPSNTYTLVDGVINASFGSGATFEITEVTNTYLLVTGTLGTDIREEKWYLSKKVAVEDTITVLSGFGNLWIESNTMYIPRNNGGTKSMGELRFANGFRTIYIDGVLQTGTTPYTIDFNGWTDVDESDLGNAHQITKVTAVSGTRIDVLTGQTIDFTKDTAWTQVRFTSLVDAQAYLATL